MTEAYNDALQEQQKKHMWETLADEAKSMSSAEYATIVADIAGIFDPTPISDGAGLLLSLVFCQIDFEECRGRPACLPIILNLGIIRYLG
ncbi:MAG: hypothetical protein SVR94_18260, partial [Pseudomonadota bacterium]|nr:hypothetical protein [Pseudomonadota bacterium]